MLSFPLKDYEPQAMDRLNIFALKETNQVNPILVGIYEMALKVGMWGSTFELLTHAYWKFKIQQTL